MTQVRHGSFRPDYAFPPGDTLRDYLEEVGLTQVDLAKRSGLSTKHVNQIVRGIAPITQETALILERVTKIPAAVWNRLEAAYREKELREQAAAISVADRLWMKSLPVTALKQRGLVPQDAVDAELYEHLLRFFGVVDRDAWEEVWLRPSAAFKKSAAFKSDPHAVATWLRVCDVEARSIAAADFSEASFRRALRDIRAQTRDPDPDRVRHLCADAGVALVFEREIGKTRTCGAAWWIKPTRAVIALTDRYKREDSFWFTFFHEAAHILLHSKKEVFIDEEKDDIDGLEAEANRFASDFLIPAEVAPRLRTLKTKSDVLAFAEELSIAPGIVVGRLQHDEIWDWRQGRDLIAKVRIED